MHSEDDKAELINKERPSAPQLDSSFQIELDTQSDDANREFNDPNVGKVFADRYTIISVLGQGGMSVVYLARQSGINRLIALKVLHRHLAAKQSTYLRFGQEAQAVSVLHHENIIGVHDFGITPDGNAYLAMDYVRGQPLERQLASKGALPTDVAVDIFIQVSDALAHAHSKKIVHRDLKPSNIMLTESPHGMKVKIVDFGIAKVLQDLEEVKVKLTQTGEAVGSPLYMSPEQCLGQQLDARSDIYSFGCVMYEAITGRAAFAAESVFGTLFKQTNEMPAGFAAANPAVAKNGQLERIVFKSLAKDPNTRYQSMMQLQKDLLALRREEKRSPLSMLRDFLELWHLKSAPGLMQTPQIGKVHGAMILAAALTAIGVFALVYIEQLHPWQPLTQMPLWQRYSDSDLQRSAAPTTAPSKQADNAEDKATRNRLMGILGSVTYHNEGESEDRSAFIKTNLDLGNSDRVQGKYEPALKFYQRAFTTARKMPRNNLTDEDQLWLQTAHYESANCYYFNNPPDFALARRHYEAAIQSMSQSDFVHYQLSYGKALLRCADCFYYTKQPDQALLILKRLLKDSESADVLHLQIQATSVNSIDAPLFWCKLADAEALSGNWEAALSLYANCENAWRDAPAEELAVIKAEESEAEFRLGHKDLSRRDFEEAAKLLKDTPPKSDMRLAYLYRQRANTLWRAGDYINSLRLQARESTYR
ncbi:MAG TPA: serine/threonine-protein kinase [Planktothrix sp.]